MIFLPHISKVIQIKNSSATLPSVPRDPLNCLTMILESRDTISYALAAYSDFMASLDRTSQTRKSSLCTTQFYKNIHTYLRVRLLHHNLSSPLHRRATRLSLHRRPEIRIFQTIRGRNFPSAKKKQLSNKAGQSPCSGDCNDDNRGGEDPTA